MHFCNYKMFIIVIPNLSKDILNCFSITQFDFTNYWDKRKMDLWRKRSIRFTNIIYSASFVLLLLSFMTYPLVFRGTFMIKNQDSSISNYRINILNIFYTLFTDKICNTYFIVFYIIEMNISTITMFSA